MIYLHQFRRLFGVPNFSPFCMKVETWLRMVNLEYEVRFEDDPRQGPLGKMPWIVDDGVAVPDSTMIIDYLEDKYSVSLDAALSDQQRAVALAFQRLIEDSLYWTVLFNRWLGNNWPQTKKVAFGSLPPLVRQVVPVLVQQKLKRDLQGQGIGRHEEETIYEFANRDLDALATYLADKPYFMGDTLSTIDAVLFAFLCSIIQVELPSPMKDHACQHANLVRYQERIGKRFFPEFY